MQADQRIEGRAKDVYTDRQAFVVNELMPLHERVEDEISTQRHGDSPPDKKSLAIELMHHFLGIDDCETRCKESNAREPRRLRRKRNNVARKGRSEALAHVINIGYYEDGKERGFSHD